MKFFMALSMKVKIIIIACTVAAAAAVGTVIVMNSEEAYRVIKVFELNGSAAVTRENMGDIDAYVGMNLESGDTLTVEENSTLQISLDSDKYILLDGGTVLKLIAQGTEADSRTVIELQTGTILNEIKNSLSANSSYEVNTPKATMAVRGTIFRVTTRQNPDGSYVTELYTSEGTVFIQLFDEDGNPKDNGVYVPKGGAVTIITDVNAETGNPAGVDGNSYFVLRTDDGGYIECGEEDAVYFPDDKASTEAQTEQSITTVAEITETSETEAMTTTAAPVTASVPETTAVPVTTVAATTVPTVTTVPTTNTVHTTTTVPTTTMATITTTMPTTTTAAATTTVPTTTTAEPITTTVTTTNALPALPFPPFIPPVQTTMPYIPDTTAATTLPPSVYKVNFKDENGGVISEAEFGANETLGTVPQIPDKRGYTGKWISGGTEVTENTVISANMEISLEYTPKPVTVIVGGPVDTPDGSGMETILTFTVPYNVNLTDSGYTIEMISQTAYDHYSGTVNYAYSIRSINVLYADYAEASDSTIITGNAVVDADGGLVCYIVCNFQADYESTTA